MLGVVAAIATFILAQVQVTVAQGSNVTSCVPGLEWTINSLGQTPCYVGSWLETTCSNRPVTVPVLPPDNHYFGPAFYQADPCWCNTVTYSLISACSACQNRTFINYLNWTINCPEVVQGGQFPQTIPLNVEVPSWAFLDMTKTDFNFNITEAQRVAASASAAANTPSPTHVTISNTADISQTSPVAASTSSASASSESNTGDGLSAGAIAGIVVGALVGIGVILLLIWWQILKNRKRYQTKPALLDEPASPFDTAPVSIPSTHARPMSDPASMITPYTYGYTSSETPSSNRASTFYTTPHGRNSREDTGGAQTLLGSQAGSTSQNLDTSRGYTGAAEI